MASADNRNEFQDAFKLNHTYFFEYFDNEEQFLSSAGSLIEEKYFIIVFGSLHHGEKEQHKLLFFNQHYFPAQEIKGYFKEGSYFAFRSDLFRGYSVRNRLKDLGFLEYSMGESLLLSGNDYKLIANIFKLLAEETNMPHSEIHSTIIVSYLNLLLYHMQRFYQGSMESRSEELTLLQNRFYEELHAFFDQESRCMSALPNLLSLSKKLNCTPRFLNDVALNLSGSSAQHHIDNFMIRIAQELLAETDLSVAEIAENMRFQEPQTLTRLFKRKTKITPLDFRISLI